MSSINERFESYVERVPMSGCWIWMGAVRQRGYGQFHASGKNVVAHRYAYETWNGPIKRGEVVCHRCDVTSCVNPSHLFAGTQLENVQDMDAKGRRVLHLGRKNPRAKLTEAQVKSIFYDQRGYKEIAADHGIGKSNVFQIKRRKAWLHLALIPENSDG